MSSNYCHRALEDLQHRLSQSNGAVSNGSTKEAEQQAAERISAAEARTRQAKADVAAARADLHNLKSTSGTLPVN